MNKAQLALGIDIGGTNTKMGIFDLNGSLINFKTIPTLKSEEPALFIQRLAQECQEMLTQKLEISLGDSSIIGVGAGAPMANYYTGHVDNAPNLGWMNVPLKSLFEKHFKCPAVIENDANLAAVGESKWGAGKDLKDFVLITLGTGVGAGLILDGKLYRGNKALGGEGGHILIPHTKTRACSCGGTNHLESFLSAKGIKETIKEMTQEEWTIEKLGILYNEGNAQAREVMNQVATEFASGLVSIGVVLGPEAFIIGGGVSKLGSPFNDLVRTKMDELIHYSLKGKIKIITATLSSDKGAVFGGAAHIIGEVLK